MQKIFYVSFAKGECFKGNESSRKLCPLSSMFALLALQGAAVGFKFLHSVAVL